MPRRAQPNDDTPERTPPVQPANPAEPADTAGTAARTDPLMPADAAATGDGVKPAEPTPATGTARPSESATTTSDVKLGEPTTAPVTPTESAELTDSVTLPGKLATAGPIEPTTGPGTELAGPTGRPADFTRSTEAHQPDSRAGDSAERVYGSPVPADPIAGSHAENGTAADSISDTAVSGPGSRAQVQQPQGALGAPEYPRVPAVPPRRHLVAYPSGALPAAGITGLVAAVAVPLSQPGIGWLLAGSAAAAAVGTVHRRAVRTAGPEQGLTRSPERVWWSIAALALLAVGTFRAAGWLFALCLAAAVVAGSLAVVGRRSERGIFRDALAVPLASAAAVAWAYTASGKRPDGAGARNRRLGGSVAVTVVLLAVFVPLLAGADATFAALVDGLIPRLDGGTLTRWALMFLWVGIGTLGALYLLAGPPRPADDQPTAGKRTLARLEWGLPVGALTAVFALFLGAQLVALFGGDDYVQRTAGLTYAEYARSGFWQLSAVTVLTLAVILPVLHRAAQDTALDRLWLRGLLCAISGLTLVMIASALGRMWTYQQAYGFTVLRLLVGTCELWLGIVYALVIVAVLRLETTWLPRSAAATATAALLALAALNPEGLVADENIHRWERGEKLDIDYLAGLSVDIVPALDRLPAPIRDDLVDRLESRLDDDTWNSWNLARSRAR